jgi:hypothetical protein
MEINYIAKIDLPFDISKGTVFYSLNKKDFFYLKSIEKKCPFNCEVETKFFEKTTPKLYDENSNDNFKLNGSKSIYHNIKYIEYEYNKWLVEIIDADDKILKVYENELIPVDYYYFINSEGDVHQIIVGENLKRDKWCKLTNNYFTSKELANIAKGKMLNNI